MSGIRMGIRVEKVNVCILDNEYWYNNVRDVGLFILVVEEIELLLNKRILNWMVKGVGSFSDIVVGRGGGKVGMFVYIG